MISGRRAFIDANVFVINWTTDVLLPPRRLEARLPVLVGQGDGRGGGGNPPGCSQGQGRGFHAYEERLTSAAVFARTSRGRSLAIYRDTAVMDGACQCIARDAFRRVKSPLAQSRSMWFHRRAGRNGRPRPSRGPWTLALSSSFSRTPGCSPFRGASTTSPSSSAC